MSPSLTIATDGLLKRGSKPALTMATDGLLYWPSTSEPETPPAYGGGRGYGGYVYVPIGPREPEYGPATAEVRTRQPQQRTSAEAIVVYLGSVSTCQKKRTFAEASAVSIGDDDIIELMLML